ncbi:hypothetical protein PSTG_06220 [Puccinia striiformis f. sp. tritici PST-78]|uniref:HAT C-terminal dimerisation domain-containing protein n=1 Tax=Puccinia striiformis f. sp. tritici PST-78 TaxID=1165861 RepID=A0A0L0VMM2_9BASI|nr:hypothetical protein PSTG_06220 [Puccinia striiformis f. sp. tritici PST-78]
MHPMVVKNLPPQRTVLDDIAKLYTAVQESLIETFKNHKGAMYLGLDTWQSPNGFDVLGTVIYRMVEEDKGGFHLEAMLLDFVRLQKSHTGVYLAETVQLIVDKFGLQDKIYGIVTDNASNNQTVIKEIQTSWWPHFKGESTWVHCFAHILNLIAQVLLRPFGSHKRNWVIQTPMAKNQMQTMNARIEMNRSDCKITVELEDEDVNDLSDEDDDYDQYTSDSCKKTLAKFRAIARKLNKSPNSKAHFVEICQDLECLRPHNIARDVCMRWNSTLTQLFSIVRCSPAILEWQKDHKHGPSREYYINNEDIHLARNLVEVLEPFYDITKQVSIRRAARISDIMVFIDQITSHLSTAISDKKDEYPPALRNACRAGLQLTNKFLGPDEVLGICQQPTGTCKQVPSAIFTLYRVAMVLHPSFKDKYFKLAQWKLEWIQESIRLTREMWESQYKPPPHATNSQPANAGPKKPHAGILAGLAGASEARGGSTPTNPLSMWLAGGLNLNDDGGPVNPLKWWMRQQRSGNTHGGLLQMALDVLSCPATTVDVEQSFSFRRDYVSLRRHRLSASLVTRGMAVSFYAKNGKIKSGVLRKWKLNKKNEEKRKGKGKSKRK